MVSQYQIRKSICNHRKFKSDFETSTVSVKIGNRLVSWKGANNNKSKGECTFYNAGHKTKP